MRTVKNFINEKFDEDSDPIHDMGIGMRVQISKWLKEIGEGDLDEVALYASAREGKLDFVKYLIAHKDFAKGYKGEALRIASQNGHLGIVKYLAEHGAKDYEKALIWACIHNQLEIVKYLVELGADIHFFSDEPLRAATQNKNTDIEKYLKSLMNESINEKFEEDSDPIKDMGIGTRHIIKNWYKKIVDLDEKLCKNFKFKFLIWDLSATPSRVPDEKDIKNPMLSEDIAEKLIQWLFLKQDALFFVFYSNKIVYETPSGDYKYIQKIEYANDILEQLNLLSFLEFESMQSDYGTNEIKYEILPKYVDYFKEGLKESLNEKFTEDSDPIDDMGIGKKHLIEKWLKKQSTKYPGYQFTYTIINDKEIFLSGSLLLMENIPDYIQLKYIDGNVILNKGVSSFKGLPNKINGYLSINSKDITSLDGAPNDLNVSVFFKNEIDKEEIKKYVKKAVDENRNISINSYYNDSDLWTKNNIQVEHFLNESLFEKFTEDSDPIVDMGIGIKLKIKNWLKDNGIYNYTIDSNFEINVEEQLHINENLPDYIQFKIVGHSVYAKNLTSAKGFPRKIERLLQISDSSLNTFDDVPVDLRVTLFLRDVKFPEEELKKYIMRAAKHQTHIKVTNNWQEQTFYPSNNYGGYI